VTSSLRHQNNVTKIFNFAPHHPIKISGYANAWRKGRSWLWKMMCIVDTARSA